MCNQIIKISIFILFAGVLTSCSSSNKIVYSEPVNFDASSYINPEDYGYELGTEIYKQDSNDSTFIPVTFKHRRTELRGVKYPRAARINNIEGTVILEVYVDTTGAIRHIQVIQSPSLLITRPSVQAILKAEFKPATLNGKTVNSFIRIPIVFRMQHFY